MPAWNLGYSDFWDQSATATYVPYNVKKCKVCGCLCPEIEILEGIIKSVSAELDTKEVKWKETNLTLGDKSREAVHRWKERIRFLPEFLSDETRQEIEKIDLDAEDLIKVGKIDDVVFYFEKLTATEKIECIDKLKRLI